MNSSPEIKELAAALAAAQAEFEPAIYNKTNPHFGHGYADLVSLIDATRPGLTKNKLAVVQLVTPSDTGVMVESVLLHSSGQWISSTVIMPADRVTPQAWGASITYARRYGYAALLCVAGEEDDDGNTAQAAVVARKPQNSPQAGTAPRHVIPPPAKVSEPPAGNLKGADSFESIKRDVMATTPGSEGRLSRLALSKRVIFGQQSKTITPEQVEELRKIYDRLEKGNAEVASGAHSA